jgi:hypothetical protein
MTNTFWLNKPLILIDKDHITEIWPTKDLDYSGKLNAITRLILILSVFGIIAGDVLKIIVVTLITLVIIVIMHNLKKNTVVKDKIKENFISMPKLEKKEEIFTKPTKNNPMMNVLLPEIKYNPERKAAAPSFNPEIEKDINESAGNVGPDPKLFLDLGDAMSFEQSMQRFYTTANSRVENDQNAFAKFCYGDMPSCKSGDNVSCLKENPRWINY